MQVQKDVLIAGGVVVVCVALVVVALVATGKHDKGAAVADNSGMVGNPGTDMQAPEGDSGYANGGAPFGGYSQTPGGGNFGGSPLAPQPPAPQPGPDLGGSAFTPVGPPPVSPPMTLPPPTPIPPAPLPGVAPVAPGGQGATTHVVAKGETLSDISQAHYGTSKYWRKIVEANPGLDPVRLKLGQVLQIPAVDTAATTPSAPGGAAADGTYTVERGDSYYSIAKKQLGSPSRWREIERLNNVPAEDLKPGTVLKLPAKDAGAAAGTPGAPVGAAGGRTHIVAKGETLGDISKQYFGTTTKWKAIVEANPGVKAENLKVGQSLSIPDLPAAPVASEPAGAAGGYVVKAGDTLESIAAAQLGKKSAWKEIAEANPGLKPSSLRVGQRIVIPGASAPTPAPAPAPAPGFGSPSPSPAPGASPGFGTPSPAPAPAPAPSPSDDLFFSPYDNKPAPAPAAPGGPVSVRAPAAADLA